jgi:diguanylate cyclase (GGDEF)-like protein
MLDIDHFKDINDQFGHPVGDQVLANLARRCRAHVRQIDILGRYGGEEFAILLPETEPKTAREIAERIRHAIDGEPVTTSAGPVRLSISLGVTSANTRTITLESLLAQADEALYKAKEHGRNRVEIT